MSTATKRRYTDEFKREAVAHWQASGKMQTEVARELGIQLVASASLAGSDRGGGRGPVVTARTTPALGLVANARGPGVRDCEAEARA